MLEDFEKVNNINNDKKVKESSKFQIPSSKNKGVSLYFGVIITSVLLAMALGISVIIFSQMKIIKGMGDSVVALYAADTGIERVLNEANPTGTYSGVLSNDSSYKADVLDPGTSDCSASTSNYCIKSIGVYMKTRRAIEISR